MRMWNSVDKIWQAVFEQCWEAFVNGSLPIGAVITDENDVVISVGRNRLFEKENRPLNSKIAHAEIEALHKLDISKYPNIKTYTIYTSMEPCPMCIGAIVMANLRKVKIAARDGYAGAVHLVEQDRYMASKNMQIDFELDLLETISLAMLTYRELRYRNGELSVLEEYFEKYNPAAIAIAKALYIEKRLDWHTENRTPFSEVFNEIANKTI